MYYVSNQKSKINDNKKNISFINSIFRMQCGSLFYFHPYIWNCIVCFWIIYGVDSEKEWPG